jgi:soluble lytic murein transglycosylase-like protein
MCRRLAAAVTTGFAVACLTIPAGAQTGACGDALRSVPAAPAPTDAIAPAGKFMLAEAACGPWAAGPAAEGAETMQPHIAEQLRLYEPGREGRRALPLSEPPMLGAAGSSRAPRAGKGAVAARPTASTSSNVTVQRIIALVPAVTETARRFGIDPLLLHAVAHVESRHQAQAQSPAGARGVLQVMPETARRFGLDDPRRELLEPTLNLQVGAEYLKRLQQRFGNDLALVLAAYNAGEGAVEKYGRHVPPYPETQAYVRDVLATYAELRRRVGSVAPIAGTV